VAHGLDQIDWQAPWLVPYRAVGEPLAQQVFAGASCAVALSNDLAMPVRFVPQAELPAGMAYEQFIFEQGAVPTRDGLHDFFNGLVWLRFPRTKAALNRLQAAEIARHGIAARRGPVRDAITVFDENGALLQAPPPLGQALRQRDWMALFITHRALWAEARLTVVGHALLEQLAIAPRKGLCAHVLLADPLLLEAEDWAAKPFLPLPVLGVPGWWTANESPGFYDDPTVFRPLRLPPA